MAFVNGRASQTSGGEGLFPLGARYNQLERLKENEWNSSRNHPVWRLDFAHFRNERHLARLFQDAEGERKLFWRNLRATP